MHTYGRFTTVISSLTPKSPTAAYARTITESKSLNRYLARPYWSRCWKGFVGSIRYFDGVKTQTVPSIISTMAKEHPAAILQHALELNLGPASIHQPNHFNTRIRLIVYREREKVRGDPENRTHPIPSSNHFGAFLTASVCSMPTYL